MKAAMFEAIARKHGYKPLDPRMTVHGRILIAERYFGFGDMHQSPGATEDIFPVLTPHWCTLWMLERDSLDVGQYVYHPLFSTPQSERIAAAVKSADEWVESNLRLRRFA